MTRVVVAAVVVVELILDLVIAELTAVIEATGITDDPPKINVRKITKKKFAVEQLRRSIKEVKRGEDDSVERG